MAERRGGERRGRGGGAPAGEDRAGLAPRRGALRLLLAVAGGRALSDAEAVLDGLPPEDRARARRLATGALREAGRLDAWLAPRVRRAPPPAALAALRLGAHEIGGGAAPHGVVNACVTLVGEDRAAAPARGLVNALLRQLAAEPGALAALPVPPAPPWLRARLVAAWGEEATAAIEAAHLAGAPLDLTARENPEALAATLGAELLPTGSLRLAPGAQLSALPGFAEGAFWVQDAAAALAVPLLDPREDEAVLDLCAAPGGKTLQIAARAARATALDLSAERLGRVRENLERTRLPARIVEADALDFAEGGSATGTIRRHPDLSHLRDGSGLSALVELQRRLLDHALSLLAPGGRLVFATCSLLPEEGEEQVRAALDRHPGLALERVVPPGAEPFATEWGLRTRPDLWGERGGLDGFFMARLRRGP
jgi:16S rRNA (cytosine967-C5)-methyltransferase